MKLVTQLVYSYRRMFVLGLIATAVAAFSGPGQSSAKRVESPLAPHTVTIIGASAVPGSVVTVTVELESGGDEVAGSFSVHFDASKLSPATPFVALGTGVPPGTALTVNPNQTSLGRVGLLFDSSNTFTASPPNRQLVTIRFNVACNAAAGSIPIIFGVGATPTPRSFSDALGNAIATTYVDGAVTILPSVSVGGRVTSASGFPVRGARVVLTDAGTVNCAVSTNNFGYYSFSHVGTGQSYTITPSAKRHTFTPQSMTVTTALTNVNFVGQ